MHWNQPKKTYQFDRTHTRAVQIGASILLVVGVIFALLLVFDRFLPVIVVLAALFLCSGAVLWWWVESWKINGSFEGAAISVDRDGLWYQGTSKEKSLVKWSDIYAVEENFFKQQVDVFSGCGDYLIAISVHLKNAELLCWEICNQIIERKNIANCPVHFTRYFLISLVLGVCFTWMAYLAVDIFVYGHFFDNKGRSNLAALTAAIFLCACLSAIAEVSVVCTEKGYRLKKMFSSRLLDFNQVQDVELGTYGRGFPGFYIGIRTKDDKYLVLDTIGYGDVCEMYLSMKAELVKFQSGLKN